jgi:hypothetical protein
VLDDQGQGNAEDGPKQCPHDDQQLAEPAKRSIHRASKVERTLCTLPKPQEPNPTTADLNWPLGTTAELLSDLGSLLLAA